MYNYSEWIMVGIKKIKYKIMLMIKFLFVFVFKNIVIGGKNSEIIISNSLLFIIFFC